MLQEGSFVGTNGGNIFTRKWTPEGPAKGVLVLSHGFNSHSGQYFWTAEQFTEHGFAVYALDYQGRGKSDGERFYAENISDYVNDLKSIIDTAKRENPGLKTFLLGHSAGGVIACSYTLDHQADIDGLICESFAFKIPAPDVALAILKGVSHLAPHLHTIKLNNHDFSRDPAAVAALDADPLTHNETQPAQTVVAMVEADERLKAEFGTIKLPVLIIHGTLDKATRPEGSQEFYDHAGSVDKTLKFYEGHFHDLLNDIGKEDVIADIFAWIDARS